VRILQAIQELKPGGAERVVVSVARAARGAGHDVRVAAAPGPLAAEVGGPLYPLPLLGRRLWRIPIAAAAVDRALRAWDPAVVHCHNPGIAAAASIATIRGRRVPSLVTVHGVPEADYDRAARVLELAGLEVVSCGPGVTAALEQRGIRVAETIVNGVSPAPAPADREALSRELGIDPARPLIVTAGRLVEQKGHELAIRALARIPGAFLLVAGEGPLRGRLSAVAGEAGVLDRVALPGARSDARQLLGAADVVVLPSRWEGLPLVALEALSAGTPVVATAVRGIRELLTDGADALLVPEDDSEALAAAVTRILADQPLAASLADAGRKLARQYSEEAMTTRYLQLYERLAR
jgi:glycosyltransferase involved in cell wall biosynthesis